MPNVASQNVPATPLEKESTALTPANQTATTVVLVDARAVAQAQKILQSLDFTTLPSAEIVSIGLEAGRNFQATLDEFLSKLGSDKAEGLYHLCEKLNEGVADAELPALYQEIQKGPQPNWLSRLLRLRSAKESSRRAYEGTVKRANERTSSLSRMMTDMEGQLSNEASNLMLSLGELEELKSSYVAHVEEFSIWVAAAQALLMQAREIVAQKQAEAEAHPDGTHQAELQELQTKLVLLESRALALEGAYSRLPADRLAIQQIQSAGVATLQEVVTTATTRFNNIRMTLLTLRGLLDVQGVQMIAKQQGQLDRQLESIRRETMREVVTTAANQPGDNRLEQAQQVKQIITDAGAIQAIVTQSRITNRQKFEQARSVLASAREQLATLHLPTPTKEGT